MGVVVLTALLGTGATALFSFQTAEAERLAAEELDGSAGASYDPFPDTATLITLSAGALVMILMVVFFAVHLRNEGRSIEQGRERVREAERGLEGALSGRGEAAVVPGSRTTTEDEAVPSTQVRREGEAASEWDGVSDGRALALAQLWSLTHRRLDLYHNIATNQAKRSFTSAQIAMVVGFFLLMLFVGVALRASTTAGAIVAGGLGAVSAALAGFVSKTFVKSQETAAEHLKAYFDQPLEFSRYLAAERLLADSGLSEEQKADVVGQLVQVIAAGPGASPPSEAVGVAQQLRQLINDQQ
ncbi:TRADD-N-associated membrane domain-containing protein [Streptomyces albogriseolus]|uniref:TRADD-N-associated membrane domain-containing protein n=1 Tax=Streptomyces albogriseolus TaxID=1887 RepID=UPI003CF7AC10